MTPAEIKAIATIKHRNEVAEAEQRSADQAEAVANILRASRQEIGALNNDNQAEHMCALERRESGRFDYSTSIKGLRRAFVRLSAYGDLIRILDTTPGLLRSLGMLRWGAGLMRLVPPGDVVALRSYCLIEEQAKIALAANAPIPILTAHGLAVLEIYREIVGESASASAPTTQATPTED